MKILAKWPGRNETLESAAGRLSEWLRALQSVHPALDGWRAQGDSRREAEATDLLLTHEDGLLRMLRQKAETTSTGELTATGVTLGMWAPTKLGDASLLINCCTAVDAVTDDAIVANLARLGEGLGGNRLEKALRETVNIWDPEEASVADTKLLRPIGWNGSQPRIGWLTYLQEPLEDPGTVDHEMLGNGMLLRATPTFADFEPADLEPVRDALVAEGRWS